HEPRNPVTRTSAIALTYDDRIMCVARVPRQHVRELRQDECNYDHQEQHCGNEKRRAREACRVESQTKRLPRTTHRVSEMDTTVRSALPRSEFVGGGRRRHAMSD